jgi:hypothetical protein
MKQNRIVQMDLEIVGFQNSVAIKQWTAFSANTKRITLPISGLFGLRKSLLGIMLE